MLTKYHVQITRKVLVDYFIENSLENVIRENIRQDGILNQIGHAQFHFDDNKFIESLTYIKDQQDQLLFNLEMGNPSLARGNFDRLTHACQDLYAHSNYVALWMANFEVDNIPSPEYIDPCDETIMASPKLQSGHLYYPFEFLSFIPFLNQLVIPLLPPESHARMNLDDPRGGNLFPYAFEAAVKRTIIEFENTIAEMAIENYNLFVGNII